MSWSTIANVIIDEQFDIKFNDGDIVLVDSRVLVRSTNRFNPPIWKSFQLIHSDSNTAVKSFDKNVFLVDQPGKYHCHLAEADNTTKIPISILNISEFDPFSIQDPFTMKIRIDIWSNITLKLRKQSESDFIECKSTTMFVDPDQILELEYFYELKMHDENIIRTKINNRIIEPKLCVNNFTIIEELINMNGSFLVKPNFLTSDMIVDLQIFHEGVGINLPRETIRAPGGMHWSLKFFRHKFDTLTRDAVIEWRLSVICAVTKFSSYSDIRRTVLKKQRKKMMLNGKPFTEKSFAYTDEKDLEISFESTWYFLHLFETGYFTFIKKSEKSSVRNYFMTGTFDIHERVSGSDENIGGHVKLFPTKYNHKILYSMTLSNAIQQHHAVYSIEELNQTILSFAQSGSTSADFFKLSAVCRSWYNYIQKHISITGTFKLEKGDVRYFYFDDWLDLRFKSFYYKTPYYILSDKYT